MWVAENGKPLHRTGASYASEAKFSLLGVFRAKTPVYDPMQKARRALTEVLFFLGGDDLELKPHFHKDGVEWHPVVVRMDQYLLSSEFLNYKKKKTDWRVTPLSDHPLRENITKVLGL
jgi:hypothetical protein